MKNTVPTSSASGVVDAELTGRAMTSPTVAAEMGRPAVADIAIADPAPLGLAAFGITTLMALAYGGIGQFVAGLWAFRRGNTFAATAFCSYGAFWVSYFLLVNGEIAQIKGGATVVSGFLGLYLFSWGIFTAYMTLASLAGPRAVSLVFVLLTLTFLVLAWGEWAASTGIHNFGGYLGLVTAIAALYTSFADVLNANFKRVILPTGVH
jgi:succinate-acetate transporter protein